MKYVCHQHKMAFANPQQLRYHWQGHTGPMPDISTVTVSVAPAGYTVKGLPRGPSPTQPSAPAAPSPETPATQPVQEQSSEPKSPYKERPEPTAILEDVIRPINQTAREEILDWAKRKGSLTPQELYYLLERLDGVSKNQASVVGQKYQMELMRAAQSGDPDSLRMVLPGMGPMGSGAGPQAGGGMPGMQGPGWGGFGSQTLTFWPYGPYPPPGQAEAPRERGESPEVAALKEEFGGMFNNLSESLSLIHQRLDRDEEDKRRALEKLERTEELNRLQREHKEEIERLRQESRDQIAAITDKLQAQGKQTPEVESLRKRVEELTDELRGTEIGQLRQEIAGLREREPSSPNELGVIQHTAEKVVDAAREAGQGIRDVVMGQQKAGQFPPGRRTPAEREELGKKLSHRAEALSRADRYFSGS